LYMYTHGREENGFGLKILVLIPPAKTVRSSVDFRLLAIAGCLTGGRRTRGPPILPNIAHTQKCTQVNRRRIISLVKSYKGSFSTDMYKPIFHSFSVSYNFYNNFSF
jgi:hypothetical protein